MSTSSCPPVPPLSLKDPPVPTSGSFPPVCVGSLFFLAGGDGDQLLGGLGDVVGALDDLLGEQLVVHGGGPGLRGHRLTTLHLQPGSAGGQEAERAVDGVQSRPLQTDGAHCDRGQEDGLKKKKDVRRNLLWGRETPSQRPPSGSSQSTERSWRTTEQEASCILYDAAGLAER